MGKRLRLGLQVNTTQRGFRWSEIRDLARVAEDSGWDSLWTEDHLFNGADEDGYGTNVIGPWEAWAILGGLAAATERVRIGSLVTTTAAQAPRSPREAGGDC